VALTNRSSVNYGTLWPTRDQTATSAVTFAVVLAPGNKASEMMIDAALERWPRLAPDEVPSEPQLDEPYDEIATYRDVPRRAEPAKPALPWWRRVFGSSDG
jgi:hypothetical protein